MRLFVALGRVVPVAIIYLVNCGGEGNYVVAVKVHLVVILGVEKLKD